VACVYVTWSGVETPLGHYSWMAAPEFGRARLSFNRKRRHKCRRRYTGVQSLNFISALCAAQSNATVSNAATVG